MGGLFGGGAPAPTPAPSPAPPKISDAEVQQKALDERQRRAVAGGRASTILTSGQGVADTPNATKTLLGQ